MATIRLPRIAADDYEAVRRLLKNGIPAVYAEWLDLRAKWLKEYASDNIVSIDVDPDKLAGFFDTARHTHELKTLWDFIEAADTK
jgi:hypothetical protein